MLRNWLGWLNRMIPCAGGAQHHAAVLETTPGGANPPGYLYRFRSAKNLLRRDELKNQEIYFARPDELNDPMEGFRDIYWRGDEVVWRNLLRHYILCLECAFSLLCIAGEKHEISWDAIPAFNAGEAQFTPEHTQMLDAILREFLLDPGVDRWIKSIANRAVAIRRSELIAYLRGFHFFALSIIRKHYQTRGLLQPREMPKDVQTRLQNASGLVVRMADAMQSMEKSHQNAEHAFAEIFDAQHRMMSELYLMLSYNNAGTPIGKNRQFVFASFNDEYVQRLETLAFPDWFTACFMEECHNSAVWGN